MRRESIAASSQMTNDNDTVIQDSLHRLEVLVSFPDVKRRLNYWADTLLRENEDKKELIIAALEKCVPLLIDAPQQYVSYIVAAAAASISEEGLPDVEIDIDASAPPGKERSQDNAVPVFPALAVRPVR